MNRTIEIEKAFLHAYEDDARFTVERMLQQLPQDLLYHGASHTLDYVYPEAMKLARAQGLHADDLLIIAVAALYHDTGFVDQYSANEPLGAQKAKDYALHSNCYPLQNAAQIIFDAVVNTNMQSAPKNIYEEILRDADLSVMGKPEFMEWNNRLRQEVLLHSESGMYPFAVDDQTWTTSQLKFLEHHHWFTQAAKNMYQEQKKINIEAFTQNGSSNIC